MAYRVNITPRAESDLAALYQEIDAANSDAALQWYRKLKEAVLSLDQQPDRCPVIPEAAYQQNQLRHLLYGNKPHVYRVIYRVLEARKQVDILHIRHGARRRV